MKIKELTIRNFRSLKEISMEDLQDMVILIGENGSGKTNILESLELFCSFDHPNASWCQRELTVDDRNLWYREKTEIPIEFQITLSLNPDEIEELARETKAKQQGDLKIKRSIVVYEDRYLYYRHDLIEWGSIRLQRQDENYSAAGIEITPSLFAVAVNSVLKKGFTYVSLGRENRPTTAHDSILDSGVQDEILRRSEDITRRGREGWERWRNDRKQIWGQQPVQLEYRGKRLLLKKEGISLPLELEGGGYQAVLNLLEKVESSGDIVAIEEPENHLHPALQKRLVDELGQLVTEDKKQILLATHSPFIIDRVNLKSIWFIYNQDQESKVVNITTDEQLSNAFWKIGVKPSDFLFANGVLVVEGCTDKDVYTDWAREIGMPFEDVGVIVIDAESAQKIANYLNSEVIQRTTFRLYCLGDKHDEDAKWVKEVKAKVPEIKPRFLKKGDLEDYYPCRIVQQFVKEMAPKKGRSEEEIQETLTRIEEGETVKKLNDLLRGDWWKRNLAAKVIEEMKLDEIDDEIKEKLGEIVSLKPLR